MSANLHIHLLGQFRLASGDRPLTSSFAPRLHTLLAYLVLHRGAPQPRQQLAFRLWPDSTEAQARTNLRKQVYLLRHSLPEVDALLTSDGTTLAWRSDAPFTLDVADFERGVAPAADAADPAAVRANLEHALSRYGGPLLPDCYDDWILPERERLHQMYLEAAERLIQLLESAGDYRQAIHHAQRLLHHDPLHEVTYRYLMQLHTLSGDRIGALRVYRTCETVLQRELGVEPSAATRDVYERMLRSETRRQPAVSAPSPAAVAKKHNLPLPLTSFVGRERELAEVEPLLAGTRLLTLTGAGGTGKTRLALHVADRLIKEDRFAGGVWWVELAALSDPGLVPQAIASVFRLQEQPGQPLAEALADYLHTQHALLVLDNCEHLIAECARLSEALLQVCPSLKILATSREGLGVAGETTWPVPGLSMSPRDGLMQSESVRLFVERASAALPTFRLTERTAAAVVQVCRRLDGIPLAIELAATRVKLLSVEHLAEHLNDSFRLLTGGSRTAPPRHQTLQAAIDWSHDLLSAAEQTLWRRLSAFAGGFTLAAAEAVCAGDGIDTGDVLELLSHLIDKSVVLVIDQTEGDDIRYRLLETVRQYGWDKLHTAGEVAAVRRRHAQFFQALAETAAPQLTGAEQTLWLGRLEVEHDNLRAALSWSLADGQATETGLRMGSALRRFWLTHGHLTEGRQWLEQLLAAGGSAPALTRTKALQAAGSLAHNQGDFLNARQRLEQALALNRELGDKQSIASVLNSLGIVLKNQGDLDQAERFYAESLALWRETGDPAEVAMVLSNLGVLARRQGNYERAQTLLEESLALARQHGDKKGMVRAYNNLGNVMRSLGDDVRAKAFCQASLTLSQELGDKIGQALALNGLALVARNQGDFERAVALNTDNLTLRRELGDKQGIASSLNNLGWAWLAQGDGDRAHTCFTESLTLSQVQGDKYGVIEDLYGLASLIAARQQFVHAARLFGAAEALGQAAGAVLAPDDRVAIDRYLAEVHNRLDETTFAASWAQGQALTLEQALAEALLASDPPDTGER